MRPAARPAGGGGGGGGAGQVWRPPGCVHIGFRLCSHADGEPQALLRQAFRRCGLRSLENRRVPATPGGLRHGAGLRRPEQAFVRADADAVLPTTSPPPPPPPAGMLPPLHRPHMT